MLKAESFRRGIVVSTALNIIIKAVLFLNTLVIAYYFGTSIDTDLYFYIFSTITLLAGLINGMDLAVILPEGMHIKVDKGMKDAIPFYNYFGYWYLLTGLVLFVLLFFFSVPIFSFVSAFKPSVLANHKLLLMLSSLLPVMMILSNYLTAVLTTLRYFTAPLLASGVAQLFALIALVLFHGQVGITAIMMGMLCGYFLNIVLLILFMKFKLGWTFKASSAGLTKRVKRNLISVQLGNLTAFAYNYGIIVLLSGLETGLYTAYNYGMQVVNMPNNFIVSQAAAVAGIKFNELAAKKRFADMNKIFMDSMTILLFMIIPICFLTWLYADWIVDILFHRGTFTNQSAETVGHFIRYFIYLLPCMAINIFLSRLLISVKKVKESFYFQAGFNLFILAMLFLFTRLFSLDGFTWSILIVYYIYFTVACIFLMKWLMPYINYIGFLKLVLKIIVLNLPLLAMAVLGFTYIVYLVPFLYVGLLILVNWRFKIVPMAHINMFTRKTT
ncbi:MAG TPA: lipid II flippase MurJ [Ferruginibacter sp.]|nr:lipid II flippase MurJ [Ferruginibacter sp.]